MLRRFKKEKGFFFFTKKIPEFNSQIVIINKRICATLNDKQFVL